MSEPEFAAFEEDTREQGQQEAIILYEGKILDGLHRHRACQELGREPRVVRFEYRDIPLFDRGPGVYPHERRRGPRQGRQAPVEV
jgi:ParB-like chromosome segregation protein Spo0J